MKKTAYKILAIFLISACIFGLFTTKVFSQGSVTEKKIEGVETAEAANVATSEAIRRPTVQYDAEGLKDPFEGGLKKEDQKAEVISAEKAELPPMTVQGIIWGVKVPQAIINNVVVKIGDTIEGARIVSIDKDGVMIFFQSRQIKLPSPAAAPVSEKP